MIILAFGYYSSGHSFLSLSTTTLRCLSQQSQLLCSEKEVLPPVTLAITAFCLQIWPLIRTSKRSTLQFLTSAFQFKRTNEFYILETGWAAVLPTLSHLVRVVGKKQRRKQQVSLLKRTDQRMYLIKSYANKPFSKMKKLHQFKVFEGEGG